MTEQNMFFRPSIVILVDDVGQLLYTHLRSTQLLKHLDSALQQCIGFIQMTSGSSKLLQYWFAYDEQKREDSLGKCLRDIFTQISGHTQKQEFKYAGYQAGPLQIYIIAHTASRKIKTVVNAVQRLSFGRDTATDINCMLFSDSSRATVEPPLSGIKFYYLYDNASLAEDRKNVIYTVGAEALFALIGTDITLKEEFQVLPVAGDDSTSPYRTLSSCRITFPRAFVETYSDMHISYELLEGWLKAVQRKQPVGQENTLTYEQFTRDQQDARSVQGTIQKVQAVLTTLMQPLPKEAKEFKDLLNALSFRSIFMIEEALHKQKSFVDALDAAIKQKYKAWQDALHQSWNNKKEEMQKTIVDEMLAMCSKDSRKEETFAMQVAYIDAIDRWLEDERRKLELSDTTSPEHSSSVYKVEIAFEAEAQVRHQRSIPLLTLVTFWFLITLVFSLLLSTIFQQLLLVTLACALLIALAFGGLLFLQHKKYIVPKRENLLKEYHKHYSEQYDIDENAQRLNTLKTLQMAIACMTSTSLNTLKSTFAEKENTEMEQFFALSSATQDIFVGVGLHFEEKIRGKEVLQTLVDSIKTDMYDTELRREQWFSDTSIEQIQALLVSANNDATDACLSIVSKNVREIVHQALDADHTISSIGPALEHDATLQQDVLVRLQPLHSMYTHMSQDRAIFLCSSEKVLDTAQWQDAISVTNKSESEWLLVVALYNAGIGNNSTTDA